MSVNGADSQSVCPGGVTSSNTASSGANCSTTIRGCDHGTHVAGIVAGRNGNINGVPSDKIDL